ncbi:MAG: hypothetical protein QOJ27_2602 [Sphingomonadales bacterium]|nr:hypothetical protein [Sphingomonadales bacterium]
MAEMAGQAGRGNVVRMALWGLAGLLLLAPLAAMRFTDEVKWTPSDFVFAAILFATVGLVAELTVRGTRSRASRAATGFALAAAFVIVWANGAVGMIGPEDNPYNLYFYGAIATALAGAGMARLRPAGTALAMAAAAAVQVGVALGGFSDDPSGAAAGTALAGLWLVSAALFRKAARD